MKNRPDGIYSAIINEQSLTAVVKEAHASGDIGIDTETTGLDYLTCDILGISLAYKKDNKYYGYYIPVKIETEQIALWDNPSDYLSLDIIRKHLNPLLSNESIKIYMHNAKFDLHILERHGFTINNNLFDTMIGAWVLGNSQKSKYGLKYLVKEKLGFDQMDFSEATAGTKDFTKVDLQTSVDYAGPDGDMTLRLAEKEIEVLNNYPTLKPTFELEMKVVPVLKHMEYTGALVDIDYLKQQRKYTSKILKLLEKECISHYGNININSEQQLKPVLEECLGVHLPDVQVNTLESYVTQDTRLEYLLDYRKFLKMKSVYIDGLMKLVDSNKRIHTSFYQMLKTGRLSSKKPNLQNIPAYIKETYGEYNLPSIRKAFITKPGYKFVSIDYSQLELRVITHVANEQYWINTFKNGGDIHLSTAAAVFRKPENKISSYERKQAKFVNFGLLYGESAYGLGKRQGISTEEAQKFINIYFDVLPSIQEYIESRKQMVLKMGYTETFNGRRLYFRYNRYNSKEIAAAQREGINFPIQGGASDIVKTAMYQVYKLLKNYKSKMVLQVHDELDFEMAEDEMHILIPQIVEIMNNVFDLKVDLKVDVEYGDNWEDIKEWKY